MSPIFGPKTNANKLTIAPGSTLKGLIGSVPLEDVGRYNWGTSQKPEINRALVELVGCQAVNDLDPSESKLNPTLGTGGAVHLPAPWKPEDTPLTFDKEHIVKLKKRLPMTAVEITDLTSWFAPQSGTCTMKYRLEGVEAHADKTDIEVHVARYLDHKKESRSSYYEERTLRRDMSKATAPDNPDERTEVPCGTDGADDTYIRRDQETGVKPITSKTWTWKGESKAKKGILQDPKYINSECAPYSVLVRYYKSPDDSKASIVFKESFYPRWTVGPGQTRTLDPKSLIVKWTLTHGKTKKLAHGQIVVFKGDNTSVCRVALKDSHLDAGEFDLGPYWPQASIKPDEMPYRVQLQAHTGPDEADALALAVMPTQVRAYRYKKVQFLAFHVKPPSPYAGDADHDTDIDKRVAAMIEAVQKAATKANASEDILKVFMAPEFYWRGPEGAYPVEKIETIMPKLRVESDKIEYKDWMFVFGTAIGYDRRDPTGTSPMIPHGPPSHDFEFSAITPTDLIVTPRAPHTGQLIPQIGWFLSQGAKGAVIKTVTELEQYKKYKLTFAAGPAFSGGAGEIVEPRITVLGTASANRVRVKWRICERIPTTTAPDRQWKARSATAWAKITKCVRHATNPGEFWLTLDPALSFVATGPIWLYEPKSTEITNVALVEKGYPTPYMGDGDLYRAAIYKEYISHIDFERDTDLEWDEADASSRKIEIHGMTDRMAVPTAGSLDLGGGIADNKRRANSTVGSEINTTGVGGGVVYTMNDITFGLEVCLDHGKDRLWEFYSGTNKQAVAGDRKPQVLLIPSWGATIGSGKVEAPPSGPLFNVDGSRGDSIARLHDGTPWCDEHPRVTGTVSTNCTQVERKYKCPTCKQESRTPGNCLVHTGTALESWVICDHSPRKACNGGCTLGTRCAHPKIDIIERCTHCGDADLQPLACGCASPTVVTLPCRNSYKESVGACPDCGNTAFKTCEEKFAALGKPIDEIGAQVKVLSAANPYFTDQGSVVGYNPVDIPKADSV